LGRKVPALVALIGCLLAAQRANAQFEADFGDAPFPHESRREARYQAGREKQSKSGRSVQCGGDRVEVGGV